MLKTKSTTLKRNAESYWKRRQLPPPCQPSKAEVITPGKYLPACGWHFHHSQCLLTAMPRGESMRLSRSREGVAFLEVTSLIHTPLDGRLSHARWHKPVIPLLRRLRQENHEVEASLDYIAKEVLKNKNSQMWWYIAVIPALLGAEQKDGKFEASLGNLVTWQDPTSK